MGLKLNVFTGNFDVAFDKAEEIKYDNSTSGLAADELQAATDELDGRLDTAEATLAAHLNGGASKHDASEVDYERADIDKKNIQAASDDVELALNDLDDTIGSLIQGSNYTAASPTIITSHLTGIDDEIGNLYSVIQNFSWQEAVKDKDIVTPPGSPAVDDRYLIGLDTTAGTATGAWATHDGEIAEWDGTSWIFTATVAGTYVPIDDENDGIYLFGGTTWEKKFFEATTASGFLSKSGFDIQLTNVSDQNLIIGNVGNVATSTDTASLGDVLANTTTGLTIKSDIIDNANINSAAGIEMSKLESLTANRATELDASGFIIASAITNTELNTLSGVSSNLQTQLDNKVDGPGAAVDEAIARFDSTTGKLVQNSLVTITNGGIMSGATQINVENLRLDGNVLSSTNTDGNVTIDPNGVGIVDVSSSLISNVTNPVSDQDAATKNYVDSSSFNVASIAINTSALNRNTYLVNTASSVTVTLPAPSLNAFVKVKDSTGSGNTNNITIAPNAAELIDGSASFAMDSDFETKVFVSDGTNWFIF